MASACVQKNYATPSSSSSSSSSSSPLFVTSCELCKKNTIEVDPYPEAGYPIRTICDVCEAEEMKSRAERAWALRGPNRRELRETHNQNRILLASQEYVCHECLKAFEAHQAKYAMEFYTLGLGKVRALCKGCFEALRQRSHMCLNCECYVLQRYCSDPMWDEDNHLCSGCFVLRDTEKTFCGLCSRMVVCRGGRCGSCFWKAHDLHERKKINNDRAPPPATKKRRTENANGDVNSPIFIA